MNIQGILTPDLRAPITTNHADLLTLLPFTRTLLVAPHYGGEPDLHKGDAITHLHAHFKRVVSAHPGKSLVVLPPAISRLTALEAAYAGITPTPQTWVLDMTGARGVYGPLEELVPWLQSRPASVNVAYIRQGGQRWGPRLYRYDARYFPQDDGRRIATPPPQPRTLDLSVMVDAPAHARAPIATEA